MANYLSKLNFSYMILLFIHGEHENPKYLLFKK